MGFKRFEEGDFVVSSNTVTSTVWSNNGVSLNTYHTSSTQEEGVSGPYYLSVYQTASADSTAEVQFSIAFGDSTGRGGVDFDDSVSNVSSTKAIYSQYRTLVLEDEYSNFIFGTNFTGSYFYVINLERARYKEKLLPGSLNLVISSSNSNLSTLHLTDDSNEVTLPTYFGTKRAYQIISGSNGSAYSTSTNGHSVSGSYGLFLPDISTIILNGAALDDNSSPTITDNGGCGINLGTGLTADTNENNNRKLFQHISASSGDASSNIFKLNSQETITSNYAFVNPKSFEFNYSENPSFISGSTGEIVYDYFIHNPQTYITTIGLYNDNNELLAVAKLSRPLTKDFTKAANIRVKLDF